MSDEQAHGRDRRRRERLLMRAPMMTGHCAHPQTADPEASHGRCQRNGGGNRSCPSREFGPCPCGCHFPGEEYECSECGGILKEAPHWPNEDPDDVDEDGNPEMVYTHIDPRTGRATGQECFT